MMFQCFVSSASLAGIGWAEASSETTGTSSTTSTALTSSCGASGAAASDAGVCSASVCSMLSWALSISGILLYEALLDLHDGSFDNRVHYFEVSREDKHTHDHDHGRRLHAGAVRPRHPLHLASDVAEVTPCIRDPITLLRF